MAMAFYYPQDVSDEMGPTAIQPGTQYFQQYQKMAERLPLCGKAGTTLPLSIMIYGTKQLKIEVRRLD